MLDDDSDELRCNCKALVMAAKFSTDDAIEICRPRRDQFPWIELSFVEPQTILEVEFFDIEEIEEAITITYWVTGGDSKSISLETAGGRNVPSPLDLSGLTSPAPVDIERMRLLSSRGGSAFFSLGSVWSSPMFLSQDQVRSICTLYFDEDLQGCGKLGGRSPCEDPGPLTLHRPESGQLPGMEL